MERPLVNPSPRSFVDTEGDAGLKDLATDQRVSTSPDQLSLPIAQTPEQVIGSIRTQLRRREEFLRHMPFWRSFGSALAVVSSIGLSVGGLIVGILNFGRVPPRVPFVFDIAAEGWLQADRSVLLVWPILIGMMQTTVILLCMDVYRVNVRLGETICLALSFVNAVGLITVIQMYSLIIN